MIRRRIVTVAMVAAAFIAAFPVAANAAPPNSGSWQINVGPGSDSSQLSYGYASWSVGSASVTLSATGYGMSSGSCESTYFDWHTVYGHHDARAARDCTSGGSNASNTWYDDTFWINGVNRIGVCYAPNNTNTGCTSYPGTNISGIPKNFDIYEGAVCISWIYRYANGGLSYNGGGDKRSCTA